VELLSYLLENPGALAQKLLTSVDVVG